MVLSRICALLCLGCLLAGCGTTRPVVVVEKDEFMKMAHNMPKELQARDLLDKDGSYTAPMSFKGLKDYGDILFTRLSPSFMLQNDTAHDVYLGETFSATILPDSRVQRFPNGFSINHATQKLKVNMVGIADWNGDGQDEWIVSCLVEPKRGGRTRIYYVLVPPPLNDQEKLKGTVAAVYECFGLSCTLYVCATARSFSAMPPIRSCRLRRCMTWCPGCSLSLPRPTRPNKRAAKVWKSAACRPHTRPTLQYKNQRLSVRTELAAFLRPSTSRASPQLNCAATCRRCGQLPAPRTSPTILPHLTHPCPCPRARITHCKSGTACARGPLLGHPAATAQIARLCGTIMTPPSPWAKGSHCCSKKRQVLPGKKEPRQGRGSVRKNLLPCPGGAKSFQAKLELT